MEPANGDKKMLCIQGYCEEVEVEKVIIDKDDGDYYVFPGFRKSQKSKARYNRYRAGGSRRASKLRN
jgi:hypothetical protein